MTTSPTIGQTPWEKYSPHISQTLVRMAFWILGVAVALAPSVYASHHGPSWSLYEMASETNNAHLFRDFYYIVIVISILEVTNIWERIHHNHGNTLLWARTVFGIAGAYFIFSVFTGTLEFMNLAQSSPVIPVGAFLDDLRCIYKVLGISFLTELTCGLVGPR